MFCGISPASHPGHDESDSVYVGRGLQISECEAVIDPALKHQRFHGDQVAMQRLQALHRWKEVFEYIYLTL